MAILKGLVRDHRHAKFAQRNTHFLHVPLPKTPAPTFAATTRPSTKHEIGPAPYERQRYNKPEPPTQHDPNIKKSTATHRQRK